ncbi:uncharacterized protein LOC120164801 [Hibiscus syriacus]|uniref:uncharacterized protein LOC120164801 n=1 Tax=Hibiscus syriacus TaxID=106335 RepID=UPI00192309A9|nr:uncharacterized protein LOC120164801 [Hibiscus syriacus]
MAVESETASSSSQPMSSVNTAKAPQLPGYFGVPDFQNGDFQMFPVMYPAIIPGLTSLQNQEQMNRGAGVYAVPVQPFMGHIAGIPSNNLIPLTYNIPTRSEAGATVEEQEQGAQQPQHQQMGPQRQVVVRRFQIVFQLDLLLILKLAAVIFLFNQDGSRQRLAVLVFFASLVYLYQTGALTPLIRWLSQGMQRAAAPPHPRAPAARAENVPAAGRQGNENAALAGAENENRPADDGNQAVENENEADPGLGNARNQWWGIIKEIQMIVFGFITSLLPGFHNIE